MKDAFPLSSPGPAPDIPGQQIVFPIQGVSGAMVLSVYCIVASELCILYSVLCVFCIQCVYTLEVLVSTLVSCVYCTAL